MKEGRRPLSGLICYTFDSVYQGNCTFFWEKETQQDSKPVAVATMVNVSILPE